MVIVAVLSGAFAAGCIEARMTDGAWADFSQLSRADGRVAAVPATRMDGQPIYVRASSIMTRETVHDDPPHTGHLVTVSNRLLAVGLIVLVPGLGFDIGGIYEAAGPRQCRANQLFCDQGDPVIAGALLAIGIGMTVPGAIMAGVGATKTLASQR